MTFFGRNQLYKAVFDLLPESLRERAFIGGGAAVSPDMARDIDLWILSQDENLFADANLLRDHLLHLGVYFDPIEGNAYGEIVPGMTVLKFGIISEGFPKPIQVCLVAGVATVEEALATFDLSVHQHAFTIRETVDSAENRDTLIDYHTVDTSTTPDDAIVILRTTTTPEWTYQRYIRLCHRYGQQPSVWQVRKLGLTTDKMLELLGRLKDEEGIDITVPFVMSYENQEAA